MNWHIPKMWNEGECWIIGGGTSLAKQFEIPQQVINNVKEGKTNLNSYSPYLSQLHDKKVIGVNAAYKLGNWVEVAFFGDTKFFDQNENSLRIFPNLIISCITKPVSWRNQRAGVKILKRNQNSGLTDVSSHVCWNHNSGAAAVNLAVHFGVKRIYLLGFDMKKDSNKETHWHGEYTNKLRDNVFSRHLKGWPSIKRDANKMGVEIINVNPDSAIKEFKKVDLKEVL